MKPTPLANYLLMLLLVPAAGCSTLHESLSALDALLALREQYPAVADTLDAALREQGCPPDVDERPREAGPSEQQVEAMMQQLEAIALQMGQVSPHPAAPTPPPVPQPRR